MPFITGNPTISSLDLYSSSTIAQMELGQRICGDFGTEYRYVKAGGTALVVANVLQSPAYGTDHNALVVVSGTAGEREVTVTLASSAVTADQYAGGSMSINVTPGLSQTYMILGHAAQSNATGNVTLSLAEPLRTTLSTSSRVALKLSPFKGVIASPVTTLTGSTVGVAVYAIPASEFGFIQTRGVTSVISDNSSIIMGSQVEVSLSVASAAALAGTAATAYLGVALQAKDNGKPITVDLNI